MSAKQERRKNRVVWFEIPASDLGRATKFYETVLATSLKAETFGAHELRVFTHEDDAASGCLMKGPGLEPSKSGAVVFLNADPSLDAVLARVERAGGKIAAPFRKSRRVMALFMPSSRSRAEDVMTSVPPRTALPRCWDYRATAESRQGRVCCRAAALNLCASVVQGRILDIASCHHC